MSTRAPRRLTCVEHSNPARRGVGKSRSCCSVIGHNSSVVVLARDRGAPRRRAVADTPGTPPGLPMQAETPRGHPRASPCQQIMCHTPGVRLTGKVAIVTGAGSGIGRAIALGFAREGARVAVADVDLPGAEATVAAAPAGGSPGAPVPVRVDVTDPAPARQMVDDTVARFGGLDVLVNNAAIQLHGEDGRCHEVDEGVWERTMAVNLRGPFLCTKYALPALLRSGRGAIVNIASPTA